MLKRLSSLVIVGCSALVLSIASSETLLAQAPALRQEPAQSFAQLQVWLNRGDNIEVFDKRGAKTRGQVESVHRSFFTLKTGSKLQEYRETDVQKISLVQHTSLWKGALIGGLAGGIVLPLIVCHGEESCSGEPAAVAGLFAGVGVGSGMAVAALMQRTTPLFEASGTVRLRIVPRLSNSEKGAGILISFR